MNSSGLEPWYGEGDARAGSKEGSAAMASFWLSVPFYGGLSPPSSLLTSPGSMPCIDDSCFLAPSSAACLPAAFSLLSI